MKIKHDYLRIYLSHKNTHNKHTCKTTLPVVGVLSEKALSS